MTRPPRSEVFDPTSIGVYHCSNWTIRNCFLCGRDPFTNKDCSHRRDRLLSRVQGLAKHFAIDVLGYAILSNQYHFILRNRPDQVEAMSDRDVVQTWLRICPKSKKQRDGTVNEPTEAEISDVLNRPEQVEELRGRLSNPSWLIRQMAQHMGIHCNAEDEAKGHFWESRFDMVRLLDQVAVLACLAYVDLAPTRAGLAESLEGYPHVSIDDRLRTLDDGEIDPASWLAPIALADEIDDHSHGETDHERRAELEKLIEAQAGPLVGCIPIRLEQYRELLEWLAGSYPAASIESAAETDDPRRALARCRESARQRRCCQQPLYQTPPGRVPEVLGELGLEPETFADLVHHFRSHFSTAAGCPESLEAEAERRGTRRLRGFGAPVFSRRGAGSAAR